MSNKCPLRLSMTPCIHSRFLCCLMPWNRHQVKNNIRYKGNTNNASVTIFFKSKVKISQPWCFAWENLRGGFCCSSFHFCIFISFLIFILFLYIHFLDVLHLSLFFIHFAFRTSSLTLPWTIAGFLHPFYTFSPAHRRVICDTFIFNHSVIFLPRPLRFWVSVFYLTLLHRHFDSTCVYQGLPGNRQFFLEVCRASYWSLTHRPSPSVCLNQNNPQSSYSEEFSFKFYHILAWNYLC